MGRTNAEPAGHALFDDREAWREADMEAYRAKALTQLSTVGSGNHYVDLLVDEAGFVWIGVHFGSRGLGHTSATKYLKLAGGQDGMHVPPAVVNEDGEFGQRYLAAMALAGRYAYAGRKWVVERVRQILGGAVTDTVHNHHNYAWRETHAGQEVWVVRKGATPAFPGQRGFVGGSMGDDAVIVEGLDSPASAAALYSTVHGTGRLFGRREAHRRFTGPASTAQRGPDIGRRRGLAPGLAHRRHGLLDPTDIVDRGAPGCILQPHSHMPTPRHRRRDQRPDIDAEPRHHPRRTRRRLVQQPQIRLEIGRPRREAPGERIGEHEPMHRHRHRHRGGQRGPQTHEPRLIDRKRRMQPIRRGHRHARPAIIERIGIHEPRPRHAQLIEPTNPTDPGSSTVHSSNSMCGANGRR